MSKIGFVNYEYILVTIEVYAYPYNYNKNSYFSIDAVLKIKSDVYKKHEDDIIDFLRNNVDYLDNYLYDKRIKNLYDKISKGYGFSLHSYNKEVFNITVRSESQLKNALKDKNYRKIYVYTEDIYTIDYKADLRRSLNELISDGLVTEIEVDEMCLNQ
jgi:hypothetical protein